MLAYFPSLYPDEIIYSGIARYHLMSGNRTQKQTIFDLFGSRFVCATADLPSHLSTLADRSGNVYTTDELIKNHTLYPYYTSYVSEDKAKELYRLMAEGTDRGKAHVLLGIPASSIKLPANLKYCSKCYQDDVKKYGDPFWHRSHQIPGVLVCPTHMHWLIHSEVPYTTRDQKFGFHPLSKVQQARESKANKVIHDICYRIAKRSEILLYQSNDYIDLKSLIRSEYITNDGRIRFRRLLDDFIMYYSLDFLKTINCEIRRDYYETWLHKIIRGKKLISHPLRYLLLSDFLGLDISKNVAPQGQDTERKKIQLNAHNTCLTRSTPTKDWDQRDAYFRLKAEKAVAVIKSQKVKPQRVTIAAISRYTGRGEYNILLEKCLKKLPSTYSYVMQELESTPKYQVRRLEYAAAIIREQGFKIQGWRLLKAAGLNHPLNKEVEAKFCSLVMSHDDSVRPKE